MSMLRGTRRALLGGAVLTPQVLSDSFARGDGALGGRWIGDAFAISGNEVVGAPTLLGELMVDPGMELDAIEWADQGTPTTNARDNAQAHGGTYSRHLVSDAASEGCRQNAGGGVGAWNLASTWLYVAGGSALLSADGISTIKQTTAAWEQHMAVGRQTVGNFWNLIMSGTTVSDFYADDASCQQISLPTMFASVPDLSIDNVIVSTRVPTLHQGISAGVVMHLDDAATPQNFLVAHLREAIPLPGVGTIELLQCAAGVYTSLIATSIWVTNKANARLAIYKSGTTYQLWYNGVQIGANQTIAGLTQNSHGLFMQYTGPVLDDFAVTSGPILTLGIIGDSITDGNGEWPDLLANHINYGMMKKANRSASGNSIMTGMDAQIAAAVGDDADIIIIALGTNDGSDAGLQAEYLENVQEIAASNAGATIYCMGILPKTVDTFRDENNTKIAAAAAAASVTYWNTDGWIVPATDTGDGKHPNAAGTAKILAQVLALI